MGGKKKGGGGKKKEGEEEDISVEQFMRFYRKKCTELGIDQSKRIKQIYEDTFEYEEPFKKLHIWDEIGWQGTRAIMEALKQANYMHLVSIRFWKTFCEDEGCRHICQFVQSQKTVRALELMDNKITPLGCEFIARMIHPKANTTLSILKLDHNEIGAKGMQFLAEGMAINKSITSLSLTYCNIDHLAARSLFEILIFTQSNLEELNLSGNLLRNEGIIELLKGVSINKKLLHLLIADNQFNEDDSVLEALRNSFIKNKNLPHYDIRYNTIENYGVEKITQFLEEAPTVSNVEISERISKETLQAFKERLALNKPSKKKGKKGKKGKKKK